MCSDGPHLGGGLLNEGPAVTEKAAATTGSWMDFEEANWNEIFSVERAPGKANQTEYLG